VGGVAESHRQPPATGAEVRDGAQTNPRNGADHPVPAAVPSSTRLDCSLDLGAALKGAYLFERPGGNPVFLTSEQ
jgi:hypothetical protein